MRLYRCFAGAFLTTTVLSTLICLPVCPALAQTSESKKMPQVDAASTKVLVIPTAGGPGQTGDRIGRPFAETKFQFTRRGFQVIPEDETNRAIQMAGVDFTAESNRTLANFVAAGKAANADFVAMTYVEKVKTFAFHELPEYWYFFTPKIWFRWWSRSYISSANFVPLGINQRHGSTVYTYLIDVKNNDAILFKHKNYGNSRGFMIGLPKDKWGPAGAAEDAVMFILSRTLKDYKPEKSETKPSTP